MGDISGTLSFCIPYPTLEPIAMQLSSTSWFSAAKKELSEDHAEILYKRLKRVNLPIIAYLGSARLKIRELLDLSEGDVLQLSQRVDEDLYICVGKEYRYRGEAGTHRKKKAVKLNMILPSKDEM